MILEIAFACGITLSIYILIKYTLLRWKRQMDEAQKSEKREEKEDREKTKNDEQRQDERLP